MRYNLGYMDKYPIEAAGSTIENNPMYRVVFKNYIDPVRLESAIRKAFKSYPLFQTCVEFDKEYYLRTNDKPLIILNCKEEERPNFFGKNTNNYPWRICYYEKKLCFEWLHGVSDGVGALNFLKCILLSYFDIEVKEKSINYLVAPGLEPFFDSKEKGVNFSVDPEGFKLSTFPKINRGYKTDCHSLVCDTKEVISLAKVCKSSPAPIIAILFSQALRLHLPKKAKNRKVACNIVLDLRRSLNYETMHNCVEYKRITYLDEYDKMNFSMISKIYKEKLDNARLSPNVVRAITERVKTFKAYHLFPKRGFLKFCVKLVGIILKDVDCNFVVTYPGKIDLPKEVMERIENIDFKVWHDFGECIISVVDYNGKFNVNISENYVNKGVVEDFIKLANDLGIHFKEVECGIFEQSHFAE